MSFKVLKATWKLSVKQFLIYRTTSLLTFILAFVFLGIEVITGVVFFSTSDLINGWSENDYLIMVTATSLITYLYNIFFIVGHEDLAENILDGNLDYTLLHPASSFWLTAISQIDLPSVFNAIVSLIMLGYLFSHRALTLWGSLKFIFALIAGVFFLFVTNQFFVTMTLWIDGFSSASGIMEDAIDMATRPQQIFPRLIQFIFNFLLPLLTLTNLPIMTLKNQGNWLLIYLIIFDLVLYLIDRKLWARGLLKYSSAS